MEIKQGSSASTIASVLAENDVIGSKYVFRFYIRGKDIVFQYGTFHLNRKMNYDELIEQLTTQQVVRETTDITIKEGMNAGADHLHARRARNRDARRDFVRDQ